jgi:hypothetical protein
MSDKRLGWLASPNHESLIGSRSYVVEILQEDLNCYLIRALGLTRLTPFRWIKGGETARVRKDRIVVVPSSPESSSNVRPT